MNEHDELARALHAMVDDQPVGAAPLADLVRRGRAAGRTRAVGRSAIAIGTVAVVGVGTAIGTSGHDDGGTARHRAAGTSPRPSRTAGATHRPAPATVPVRLVDAVAKTAGTSFQMESYADWSQRERGADCSGGWDPKRKVGWMSVPGGAEPTVEIFGNDIYERAPVGGAGSRDWQRYDPKDYTKDGNEPPPRDSFYCGGEDTATMSGILADMRKEGPVRLLGRKSRDGKKFDVYSVTSTKPVNGDGSYDTTQAWVNVQTGYVEQLRSWEAPKGATAIPSVTLYSHFGQPVRLQRPPVN
jgi:hypothetical protein